MGWLAGMTEVGIGMTVVLNRHPNVTPAKAGVYKQEQRTSP